MTDLDQAIRARLDGWLGEICGRWRDDCPVEGHAEAIKMRAALCAALDLHPPVDDGSGVLAVCGTCCGPSESWERHALPFPCPTRRVIAEKLGVEARDD